MPRNIVICGDGTGNEFGDNNSNVVKLYSTLVIDGKHQCGHYHPGVGTMGAPTATNRVSKAWSVVMGLAFGAGLLANISDAYRYLMNIYEDGDQVFLFGFSRGAYTARALAGVLHMFGLLCPGNEGLIPYITDVRQAYTSGRWHDPYVSSGRRLQGDVLQRVPVAFCRRVGHGEFDRLGVGSVEATVHGSKSHHDQWTACRFH
jgi:uncharacterized protein (DUF2235 family)